MEALRDLRVLTSDSAGSHTQALDNIVQKDGAGDLSQLIINYSQDKDRLSLLLSTLSLASSSDHTTSLVLCSNFLMEAIDALQSLQLALPLVNLLELLHKALLSGDEEFLHQKVNLRKLILFCSDQMTSQELSLCEICSSLVVDALSLTTDAVLQDMIRIVLASKMKDPNATVELRYATVLSKILSKSDFHFDTCLESGVVAGIISMCRNSDDVLMQVCSMELLLEFPKSASGIRYLFGEGIISWLLDLSGGMSGGVSTSADPILSAQALTTLMAVLRSPLLETQTVSSSEISSSSLHLDVKLMTRILQTIVGTFDSTDDGVRLSGLSALSTFACMSANSLVLVVNDAEVTSKWLGLLNSARAEIKGAVLHSVARVLECGKKSSLSTSSILSNASAIKDAKLHLLEMVGRTKAMPVITYLVQVARTPIDEMRMGAMLTMKAVGSENGWGLDLLFLNPSSATSGFRTFLENRGTEHTQEGRLLKFSILQAISQNPTFDHLPDAIRHKVSLMISQGPFYREPETIVEVMEM